MKGEIRYMAAILFVCMFVVYGECAALSCISQIKEKLFEEMANKAVIIANAIQIARTEYNENLKAIL